MVSPPVTCVVVRGAIARGTGAAGACGARAVVVCQVDLRLAAPPRLAAGDAVAGRGDLRGEPEYES